MRIATEKKPLSVILTTHNRPLLLRRALDSLIAQTTTNFDVIIVDDHGNYIPPYDQIRKLNGRCNYILRTDSPGPALSRNLGLSTVSSRFFMFLDDDDTIEPDHLQKVIDETMKNEFDIGFCNFRVIYESRANNSVKVEAAERFDISGSTKETVEIRNTIPNSCLVYKSELFSHIRHDTEYELYEDWDFLLSCLSYGQLTFIKSDGINIHKTRSAIGQDARRGNSQNEKYLKSTQRIYSRHPSNSSTVEGLRSQLLKNLSVG
jgi:glycosyltransferase involved in cell wall biosynthesis